MIVSSLDFVLVLCAAGGSALVLAGIAQGLGLPVPPFLLMGGGLPLFLAAYWHARVVAAKEAAYVRQTDAVTAVRLATIAPVEVGQTGDDAPTVDAALEKAKLDAMLTFFLAGQKAGGFSSRLLSPGVVGSDTWDTITDFYISGDGRQVLRDAGGNVGTVFNHGHTLDTTIRGLRAGVIPLPPGDDAPVVNPFVPDATPRSAARRKTTARAEVVDAQPSRPG